MERIAVVGAGLVGRSWAIVFARAGHPVALWDRDPAASHAALALIEVSLEELAANGLLADTPGEVLGRIRIAATLADAVGDVALVQESAPERLDIKQALTLELDALAPAAAILASSTSSITCSEISGSVPGRARCLVGHPVNPPHLVPLVEISPAPWTDPDVVARARALYESVGQSPIVLLREVQGFILNRLQGAVLHEAYRLYEDGYASADDIDRTMRDGLGLRWSFMGPFETIDLNAPGGLADYAARYGWLYEEIGATQLPRPWDPATIARLEAERRAALPASDLAERSAWRDRRLTGLVAHKRRAQETEGGR